jgi:predicted RNase H-like HicB family nuclease
MTSVTPHYHINVFWSDEDGCWIADVPDLRFCSAHGGTPAAAVAEVEIAMSAWLDSAREHGHPVPEARYRPLLAG